MSAILYLNRSSDKSTFDMMSIRHSADGFVVFFWSDVTNNTVKTREPDVLRFATHHDLLDYLEDSLDIVMADTDTQPYASLDTLIPGFPTVCLKPDNHTTTLLIRAMRTWCKAI